MVAKRIRALEASWYRRRQPLKAVGTRGAIGKNPALYIWQNIRQTTTTASSMATDFGRHAYYVALDHRIFTGFACSTYARLDVGAHCV